MADNNEIFSDEKYNKMMKTLDEICYMCDGLVSMYKSEERRKLYGYNYDSYDSYDSEEERQVYRQQEINKLRFQKEFKTLMARFPEEICIDLQNQQQWKLHHPEGSVWNHMLQGHCLIRKLYPGNNDLVIVNLFHDLGKLDTSKEIIMPDNSIKITAHNHAQKSLDYIDKYFDRFSDYTENREMVYEVVKDHMIAHFYTDGSMSEKRRKKFETSKYFKELMMFEKIDKQARAASMF